MAKINPFLPQTMLSCFWSPEDTGNRRVDLCALTLNGKCEYFRHNGAEVRSQIWKKHADAAVSIVKIFFHTQIQPRDHLTGL